MILLICRHLDKKPLRTVLVDKDTCERYCEKFFLKKCKGPTKWKRIPDDNT